uniref:Uncharacterized protein n=1 Tax=Meloidogyne enterolobii TaxID=390850 RepID=A0A6V7TZM2_MELEN|nr:unnamed protein product [Meloidogyne enterolobii]
MDLWNSIFAFNFTNFEFTSRKDCLEFFNSSSHTFTFINYFTYFFFLFKTKI